MFRMIIEAITAVGNAISQIFGFANKRTDLKNQADVKAAAIQTSEDAQVAADTKAVADNDLEEIRKKASE